MKGHFFTLFFALICLLPFSAYSQTCKPDTTLPDSVAGVFPLPYNATTNTGGINDTACVNTYFEFNFTMKVPDSFSISGISLPIIEISFSTDSAISNIPAGFKYKCDPPNCVFKPDTLGCVVLYGTPAPGSEAVYDLMITGKVITPFLPLDLTFPNDLLYPGNYNLHVRAEGHPSCSISSLEEVGSVSRFVIQPNPMIDYSELLVVSAENGTYQLRVHDLLGRQLDTRSLQIFQGENRIPYINSELSSGIYLFTLSDGIHTSVQKIRVHKN